MSTKIYIRTIYRVKQVPVRSDDANPKSIISPRTYIFRIK